MKLLHCSPLRPELPALIYLPGMDGTGKLIHRQSKALSDFFNLYSLALPPTDMSNWDELAQGVIAVVKSEVKRKSIYLCGESFGGCLALKVTLKAPEMISKLILVNPASSLRQSSWLGWGISINQWLPEIIHHTSALGLLPFLASLGRVEACDRRELLQAMRTLPQAVVCWRLSLLYNFCVEPFHFKQFTSPALIIASAADRLLSSVEEGKRLQNLFPQAQLEVLPQSGHACLLESAIDLTKILKQQNFLPAR